MIDTRKSVSLANLAEAAAAVTDSSEGVTNLPAPELSRRFATLLAAQSDWLLLDNEYWSQAVRDPALRARYAQRQAGLRAALGKALAARIEHLGGPPLQRPPEEMATNRRLRDPSLRRALAEALRKIKK